MMLDKTVVPLSTAADVSSHDDSIAKIYSFISIKRKDKDTKKKIIHSILIVITILFALLASVYVVILDRNVQSMLARTAAGFLSDKFDTEVKIKTFYISSKMDIYAEDVLLNDKYHNPMIMIGELKADVSPRDLINGLKIRKIYLKDVTGNIVKYENDALMNITELFRSTSDKKKDKKKDFQIKVDELILDNGHVVVWNQNKDKPGKDGMDYSHLDIDSINASFSDVSCENYNVSAIIKYLSGADKSGLVLDTLSSQTIVTVSDKGLDFKNLNLKTQATSLDMDLHFYYNNYRAYLDFVDSIRIYAKIRPSQLTLSDLRYFAPVMGKMKDTLNIEGIFDGSVSDFNFENFAFKFKDSTDFLGTIRMKGLPDFFATHIYGNVKKMNFTYQDISEFFIPTATERIPLPKSLAVLKKASLSGTYEGFHNNFKTKINLLTNIGDISLKGSLNNDLASVTKPEYNAILLTNEFNVKNILGMKDDFIITMESKLNGKGFTAEDADMELSLDVNDLYLMKNSFKDFVVTSDMENQRIILSTNINERYLDAKLNGLIDLSNDMPSFDMRLNVEHADLYGLKIYDNDKKMLLSTSVEANLRGSNIDKTYGNISIENTTYNDSRGEYKMNDFNIDIVENQFYSKDIALTCDFFDMDVRGVVNFSNIGNTFKNYVLNYFNVKKWKYNDIKPDDDKQDFSVNLAFKNTKTLTNLLMPSLTVSDNTTFTATFTSDNYQLYSTLTSDAIDFNGLKFNKLYFKTKNSDEKITANLAIDEFVMKEATNKNPVVLSLENLGFAFDAHNDTLLLDVAWDDDIEEDRNKADIRTTFISKEKYGGMLRIHSSDIVINDNLWNISPSCYFDFRKNGIFINHFDVYSGKQSLSLNGYFPKNNIDTLYVDFNEFDISNFDLLTKGTGVDIDGFIDGSLQMSGLSDRFTLLSNLDVDDIAINKQMVGDAILDAIWNSPDTSIYIRTEVIRDDAEDGKVLALDGKYYTSRKNDNLDFSLNLNAIDISVITPFVKGTISRIGGYLNGELDITGSMKKPVVTGDAKLYDAACKIDYLNTYYKVNAVGDKQGLLNGFIKSTENKIELTNIVLTDTLGNHAVAKGVITHDYLKDFDFDIDIELDNFLAIDLPPEESASFYATAIANGDVKIDGKLDDIAIDINAEAMSGTTIDIILTSSNTINDNFIVFLQKNTTKDTVELIVPETDKNKKFTIDLNADVDQNTNVDIHLPSNMGNITATGNGNIKLGYATDQLSLYGDYVIDKGTFSFNFQNLARRDFVIRPGGTISWTGDAADADINVVGVYRTKSSISSLGIEIDSTSLVNNINVDCIIRLQDKLSNPTITFAIELPNVTDDIRNTVFSIIDTTNQAVMSQQIISLLVLGSFSYSNSNLYSIGASNAYNVITSSLSSWLSQISKDFDIGVRYTPEDNLTAEELEVSLSTQLFDDRLTIEGNLGMYTGGQNDNAQGANNIVGDFDMTFKITNRLSLKAYNHSNLSSNYYSYTYETYSDYTQGIGISYSQSFDSIRELFTRKNKNKKNQKRNNKR